MLNSPVTCYSFVDKMILSFIAAFFALFVCCNAFTIQSSQFKWNLKHRVFMTNVDRNDNFAKLSAGYLFPEIARRRNAYLARNPDAKIISLGIGDTTLPIPPHILNGLIDGAKKLGTKEGYSG